MIMLIERAGHHARGIVIGLSVLLLGACATVPPYERETLARRDMALEQDPDASAGEHHATSYREGASGAEGTSGGGCGCN